MKLFALEAQPTRSLNQKDVRKNTLEKKILVKASVKRIEHFYRTTLNICIGMLHVVQSCSVVKKSKNDLAWALLSKQACPTLRTLELGKGQNESSNEVKDIEHHKKE